MPESAPPSPKSPVTSADYLIRHATLRQLQLLEAVVRLGSFTRAAEELFLTQPTVSMQIKKLADSIGAPLFEQIGRKVGPTDAGREVHSAAIQILSALSNLEVKLADLKGLRRGQIRLGVVTTAKYVAPELLGAFCEKYPGIDISLKVTNRDNILERLHANQDDLYITGHLEDIDQEVEIIPFSPNPLVLVARRDHPLVGKSKVPLKALADEYMLLREPGSGIRDAMLLAFNKAGVKPKVRMQIGSSEAIKYSIVGGLGISVLSLHSLMLDSRGGRLALIDAEGFPLERRWCLVYPRNRELSRICRAFLDFVAQSEPEIRKRLDDTFDELKRRVPS